MTSPMTELDQAVHDGRGPVERDGFWYLPRFITTVEADALIAYFGGLMPLWEKRYHGTEHGRPGAHERRLTRPVYWLGAWQFACLGYYEEPDHTRDRCLRAEPFPSVMRAILDRLAPRLRELEPGPISALAPRAHRGVPNTCLINYYGSERRNGQPVDLARLRMHRDREPGPVVMFCIGQPGLLEFIDHKQPDSRVLGVWTRHRSVTICSGPEYKDRLYHRISQVRHGQRPVMSCQLPNFHLRRISVSFRHVPERAILDLRDMDARAREHIAPYVHTLGRHVAHYRRQLDGVPSE